MNFITLYFRLQKKIMRRNLQDKLGRVIETDNHEDIIAAEVIHPNSIDVTMDDIGGLEETKSVLVRGTPSCNCMLKSQSLTPACRLLMPHTNIPSQHRATATVRSVAQNAEHS